MSDLRFNQWLHQSGTGGVTQLSSGHVGIGTTNPLIPVHSGNNAVLNVGVVTANNIYAGTLNGTLALSDISGITGSFTSDLTVNGNLDIADKIRHIGDTDTAIRFTANDTVTVETAGNERLRIDSTGKIGIGKVPSRTLDVQGKIRSSDSVCFGDNSSTPSEGAAIHRPAASTLAFVTNDAERLRITSTGILNAPTQAGFYARLNSNINDITGDGTYYTVVWDTDSGSVCYDQHSTFSTSTGLYTIPTGGDGVYQFSTAVCLSTDVYGRQGEAWFLTNTGLRVFFDRKYFPSTTGTITGFYGSCLLKLTAGQTVGVQIFINGGSKNVDVFGAGAGDHISWFSGRKIA